MSERPTDMRPSRAAAAHGSGRNERARYAVADAHAGGGPQSLADRAASFRQGAPFLVERATLYDPEPLDPLPPAVDLDGSLPSRRLLPAALTLLGVVAVVGLAAGILLVRNADVVRTDEANGRLEQFSERGLPPSGAAPRTDSDGIAYDLTRRPNDAIVGAWRPRSEDGAGSRVVSEAPPAARKRRPLPRRMGAEPPLPPEPVTRPVVASPPPRYDAPEPRRRLADGDPAHDVSSGRPGVTAEAPPAASEQTPAALAERQGPSVVARVGRAGEPLEMEGPAVEIPLERLALPKRRPNPDELDGAEDERHSASSRPRRSRLLRFQRQIRRQERYARKREYDEKWWMPEALYGNRQIGLERLLP